MELTGESGLRPGRPVQRTESKRRRRFTEINGVAHVFCRSVLPHGFGL